MKRSWIVTALAVGCAALLGGCAAPYRGPQYDDARNDGARYDENVADFYDALAPYGTWFYDDEYGWLWSPSGVPLDWRPYTDGEWAWTDDGWTWVSDREWGWAAFHYGRWCWRSSQGWCWRAGREWAPAWVAWRDGGGWIGWCPLPPACVWNDGFGGADFDDLPGVEPFWWSFCGERDFSGPRLRERLVPLPRAAPLVRQTRNATDYRVKEGRVFNGGVDPVRIGDLTGQPVPHYRVSELTERPGGRPRGLDRGTVYVYRPRLGAAPPARETRPPAPLPSARTRPQPFGRPAPSARAEPGSRPSDRAPAPNPGPDLREQFRREELELGRRHDGQRQQLTRRHRAEEKSPPGGEDAQSVRQRHEAERTALEAQLARELDLLRAKHAEQLKAVGAEPAPPAPARRPRGKDAGREGS